MLSAGIFLILDLSQLLRYAAKNSSISHHNNTFPKLAAGKPNFAFIGGRRGHLERCLRSYARSECSSPTCSKLAPELRSEKISFYVRGVINALNLARLVRQQWRD
jgi:hypothetical protein